MKTIMLNEIRSENDEYVMKSCLVNLDHVISIQSGKLSKKGAHIIGTEHERELRMIRLRENGAIFVDESVEEIADRIAKADFVDSRISKNA